ncbi:hypothetical protein BOTBODRAFT_529473 [Botryobasidium botryosum FD-172 SS1]|uniref:histidine kinase n=1 Tax=Botryobasidium botryosum (strain FD-172 SS1) TaxID=930990 RepID=A0A067M0V9_BOTB1|nr:hypothetical protein BOTBODRAFT_529473 [Botryobasidium botryosum FD-172 SS1]
MRPLPAGSHRQPREAITFQEDSWKSRLGRLKKRILTASSPSNSMQNNSSVASSDTGAAGGAQHAKNQRVLVEEYAKEDEQEDWETSKVVVGQDLDFSYPDGLNLGHLSSEHETSQRTTTRTGGGVDASEFADDFLNWRYGGNLLITVKDYLANFFDPRFPEEEAEGQFQKERWFNNKSLALAATLFMLLNWVLYLIFNHSETRYQKIAYYGIATIFVLPLPAFVAFDFPRRPKLDILFQVWLTLAAWSWAWSEVTETHSCHFFEPEKKDCGYKDFLFMMTYAIALPTLVLFSCYQKRGYATIGALVMLGLLCGLVLPVQVIFVRNVVSFLLFTGFFIILHYVNERIDRRNFILRAQLKISFKAQQKAQIAQKQAANSKRRFISYIFHEVRVPLNSAMLAFQNLQTNPAFAAFCSSNASSLSVEIAALEGSMSAMKQVLDDVLDLQRMDSGRFESNPHAFEFHQCVRSMLGTLRVATDAKGLPLKVELDGRIDEVVANGSGSGSGSGGGRSVGDPEKMESGGGGGTWVVGDSLRLRQVLSNFFSNAVKFTPEGGGTISVKTSLLAGPQPPPSASTTSSPMATPHTSAANSQLHHAVSHRTHHSTHPLSRPPLEPRPSILHQLPEPPTAGVAEKAADERQANSIVVRIEVSDSGPGIRPSDAARLFEPFVQTNLGIAQAGKGSGLGLAIVRQIVSLTGGRLGFCSRKNGGSTFWVEFRWCLATPEEIQAQRNDSSKFTGFSDSGSGLLDTPTPRTVDPRMVFFGPLERPPSHGGRATPHTPPEGSATPGRNAASPSRIQLPEKPLRVLVVDDDPTTRTLMSRMLTRLGAEVTTACDGQQALDILLGPAAQPEPTPGSPNSTNTNTPNTTPSVNPLAIASSSSAVTPGSASAPDNPATGAAAAATSAVASASTSAGRKPEEGPQYFDLISLDNAMPVMTGQEAVRKLRSAGRNDFVVGATGNALKGDQKAYLEAGADQVLSKPVMLKDLKAALQTALERRKLPP